MLVYILTWDLGGDKDSTHRALSFSIAESTKLQNKNSIGNVTINTGKIHTKEGCEN